MAEVLLGIVIENLGSCVQKQLASYWSVDQQTQKLSGNLTAICAVLRDAEKKQITSKVLKNWLQKLTDAAYMCLMISWMNVHFNPKRLTLMSDKVHAWPVLMKKEVCLSYVMV
ncbi:hypothetical protein PHAVU_002G129800 [Phaseolus vulgaris]|uniref:Disease resistance N-terminal domain-containing protein n=1 Tax=Phaseolus vulgaris TaxID=3885 RepID=V7CJ23_PHAVU|nr:hypothetical protein PHAVU_002G129800g [Phaseolus vulgaris]ESW30162.1 hypothetical protein PHAVU_002G129800g [Phaseolus vulgaris]